ncbi:hypothetical protein MS6204_03145 [Escherichia coli]|nr:hypothetical protein [Escherichia coli]
MGNFGNYFIFIMAFVAIIDRFIFVARVLRF